MSHIAESSVPPSPADSFLDWDEHAVADWLDSLGLGQYGEQAIEQGITGDVLALLHPSTLTELGITSLGHRIGILRAVYDLKLAFGRPSRDGASREEEDGDMREDLQGGAVDGWDWGEEDWVPAGEPHPNTQISSPSKQSGDQSGSDTSNAVNPLAAARLWEAIREQNDRMAVLEREYRRVLDVIDARRGETEAGGISGDHHSKSSTRDRQRQETVKPSQGSSVGGGSRWSEDTSSTIAGRESKETLLEPQQTHIGRRPSASHSPAFHSLEQTVLSPSFHSDPPANPSTSTAPTSMAKGVSSKLVHATPPTLARMMSSSGIIDTPVTAVGPSSAQQSSNSAYTGQDSAPTRGSSIPTSTPTHIGDFSASSLLGNQTSSSLTARSGLSRSDSTSSPSAGIGVANKSGPSGQRDRSKKDTSAAGVPQKSLRTNMDDPCWKVLPAALKKYKINDDWRKYAMFICYGDTERCLSYDEKPLLLFQKLKDADLKPVFMLRHIRDVKSPIAIAQQKQAERAKHRESPSANKDQLAASQSTSAKSTSSGAPNGSSSSLTKKSSSSSNPHPYSKDTRLHRPPVLQPISARAKAITAGSGLESGKSTPSSGNGNFPELPSPGLRDAALVTEDVDGDRKVTYVIAIYPYMSEREDEYDVTVGSAFIVLNKVKGWWVVQRDPDGTGKVAPDKNKSGWIPAGCLLETSLPIGPSKETDDNGRPTLARQAIPLPTIISSSFQGTAMMDYDKRGEHELQLRKDDMLKVFKRYAHWSYAIHETSGERGWVPSWYVGKVSSSDKGDKSTSSVLSPERVNEASEEGKTKV